MNLRLMAILLFFLNISLFIISANDENEIAISPDADKVIVKALAYLSTTQNEDGSWTDSYGKNVGVNSLILMSFMSLGNLPGEGKYGDTVAKGLAWVMKQSKESGLIENTDNGGGNAMYGHGLATLMLSEIWGQTRRKDVGEKLRKAVDLIVKVQGPKGAWCYYSIPKDGDTSITVMQVFALKSAHDSGMYVPEVTMKKAISTIKSRFDEKNFMYGYNGSENNIDSKHVGSHAAGTCIIQICGEKEIKYTTKATEKIIEILEKHKLSVAYPYYFVYYGSVSTYYAGPKYYKKWCETMVPLIVSKQSASGEIGNKNDTAWAVLALSLPYRYIPVYQHEGN
jgi:hypothetical protein